MDKKAFTIVKWNANRWCVSYEGDAINGKKAFSVNDIGVINQVGDFGTLKEARNWVDLDCPVSEIEKSINITHYVWAMNIKEAYDINSKKNALDTHPVEFRSLLSNLANDAGIDIYDDDAADIFNDYMEHHASAKIFQ